jgi:hypothetical protein
MDCQPKGAAAAESLALRRAEEVEVRSLAEIRATLDERGTLDGMPFMPEMERFAGRRARVWRRADRVCVEGSPTFRRVKDTVFLEDLRCDGSAHAGCQRGCLLLWNEAWLRRPGDVPWSDAPATLPAPSAAGGEGTRFFCQSTELMSASTALPPWWRPGQYLRDLATRNLSVRELALAFAVSIRRKLEQLISRRRWAERPKRTPSESLGLAAGDWVEVKSLAEIEATLDRRQANRGLTFSPSMIAFCGRRYRVGRRMERMILERTGEMQDLADTVVLESAVCDGLCTRGCPRANVLYWREIWLRRAAGPSAPPP